MALFHCVMVTRFVDMYVYNNLFVALQYVTSCAYPMRLFVKHWLALKKLRIVCAMLYTACWIFTLSLHHLVIMTRSAPCHLLPVSQYLLILQLLFLKLFHVIIV